MLPYVPYPAFEQGFVPKTHYMRLQERLWDKALPILELVLVDEPSPPPDAWDVIVHSTLLQVARHEIAINPSQLSPTEIQLLYEICDYAREQIMNSSALPDFTLPVRSVRPCRFTSKYVGHDRHHKQEKITKPSARKGQGTSLESELKYLRQLLDEALISVNCDPGSRGYAEPPDLLHLAKENLCMRVQPAYLSMNTSA
ncbi:hypothetical protein FOL47_010997 [Perkinsus chesapeaki]|uniref:Uncharacterized protein n=1 Tax=Perkinsus chesapeaki TaxID=330153 RepID=A0A7J6L179_PERCH|nr:hypothetical protein FOL47_010997 [Perkinsus chesapeaki]